jgi:acetoin utilization protein AcuB
LGLRPERGGSDNTRGDKMGHIKDFMSASSHAIGRDQNLKLAHDRMQQWGIIQAPVLDGGVLTGVISERDIALIRAVAPEQLETILVEEAMVSEPYTVAPTDDIGAVVTHMLEHKHSSAVVMDHNKVVGVFTSLDALRLLSDLLKAKPAGKASDVKAGKK